MLFPVEENIIMVFIKNEETIQNLKEVLDVYALKITTSNAMDCYKALGVIHNAFNPSREDSKTI